MMTLFEYIEKRAQVLDKRMENIMNQDDINYVAVAVVNSAIAELIQLKIALEDGILEGENNDSK